MGLAEDGLVVGYAPRGEGTGASGWRRVGRYDRPRRRALWARLISKPDADSNVYNHADLLAIELCAGREGDDAFVRLEPCGMRSAWWSNLIDVVLTALDAVDEDSGYVVRVGRSYLSGWSINPDEPIPVGLGFNAEWSTSRDDALVVADEDQAKLLARLTNAKVEPVNADDPASEVGKEVTRGD